MINSNTTANMATRKTWYAFLFLLLANIILAESEENSIDEKQTVAPKEEDGVLVLTNESFNSTIEKEKFVLVEFYAPWCGHCKALAPAFAEAAKELKKSENPVPLAKVDCTVERKVCDFYLVQGYPTLKWFKDGEASDYNGPRDHPGIINYVLEKSDPNWKPPAESVVTLTKENFDEYTKKENLMLVEFFAPWCGHCKKIGPELEKAAKALEKREKPIVIGKVDATVESDLASRFEVTGYPTMFIFRNGKKSEYKGPRNEPGISQYLINQEGPATKHKVTMRDVKNFLKEPNNDAPVILAVVDSEEDPLFKLFLEANNDVRDDYLFGHTFAKETKKYFGLKKSAILLVQPEYLQSKHEPKHHTFMDENGSPSELQAFYKKNLIPLVGHFQANQNLFEKRPLVLVFYDVNFSPTFRSMTQFWRNKVLSVAKEFPDIQFAVAKEENFEGRLKDLGLIESGEDVNVGLYDQLGRRYAMVDEDFSEDSLTEFVEEFLKGNLKPIIKSQSASPKAKPGKVQVVTGNTFDKYVMDETKEVFIEFYAPWCGNCKAIEPTIIDLADKYKGEKDIVIAKMDGTENEGPSQYSYTGFPTIYYAVPGKKLEPVKLDGKRTLEGLVEFVESNSNVLKKEKKKTEL